MTDMQKIDFHYNVPDRLRYACLVARTVYRRGLTLAVWTADERRLRELDSLLWRFDDLAFLPHVRAGSPLASETPIRLSSRLEELEGDVLLLLDDQLPPEWQERLRPLQPHHRRGEHEARGTSGLPQPLPRVQGRRRRACSIRPPKLRRLFHWRPMPMERKEPVIDSRAVDLTDRVKLTWRDVRTLADEAAASTQPQIRADEPPSPEVLTTETATSSARLTPDERAALAAQLAPAVEAAVKHALRETLDLALQNALARVRGDVERSVNGLVAEAVSRELERLDLDKIARR